MENACSTESDNMALAELLLLQLSDSGFPTGSFSHSVGYEAAVKLHIVDNSDEDFKMFAVSCLENAGSLSVPFLQDAYKNASSEDRLVELDALYQASVTNHVANRASVRQGRALVNTSREIFCLSFIDDLQELIDDNKMFGHYPVVLGYICAHLKLELPRVLNMFMFGVLRTISSGAVRLGHIGCFQAQRLLFNLQQLIPSIITRNAELSVENAHISCPIVDIVQNMHDTLFARLFYS